MEESEETYMICEKCKKETDKIVEGMCIDCFNQSMDRLREVSNIATYMAEKSLREGISSGEPVSKEAIKGMSINKVMNPEEFKKTTVTRKVFALALIKMANINDASTQLCVSKDIEWMIDNELEKFWGKNIRLTVGETYGSKILAHRNDTYIVEGTDD